MDFIEMMGPGWQDQSLPQHFLLNFSTREWPQCFLVKWNNERARTGNPEKYIWQEAYGVRFPNGRVATDYGPSYEHLSAMKEQLERQGRCQIIWQSGKEE